jgi:acyl dehydratase
VTLAVGEALPDLVRTIELADMVAYAGATWDWHRLHHDATYVASLGLPGPVVDGQQLGALLAEHVQDALGPRAFIESMGFRFRAMVFAGETVRCVGSVTAVDGDRITVNQEIHVDDRVVVDNAHATVRSPA